MDNLEQICEKAIAIISLTHDGNDLSPSHLHLTECAVNGFLSDKGLQDFDSIYEDVINGRYCQPWLQGIEHLTVDHEGYIYFKGQCVEHYDRPYDLENKGDLKDLAARCRHLEQLGVDAEHDQYDLALGTLEGVLAGQSLVESVQAKSEFLGFAGIRSVADLSARRPGVCVQGRRRHRDRTWEHRGIPGIPGYMRRSGQRLSHRLQPRQIRRSAQRAGLDIH